MNFESWWGISMNKKVITIEQVEKIKQAAESVKGTMEYNKYSMCCEIKRKTHDKWTGWKYVGWSYPKLTSYIFKTVKGKIYMISNEYESFGDRIIERYEITEAVKELLEI